MKRIFVVLSAVLISGSILMSPVWASARVKHYGHHHHAHHAKHHHHHRTSV